MIGCLVSGGQSARAWRGPGRKAQHIPEGKPGLLAHEVFYTRVFEA